MLNKQHLMITIFVLQIFALVFGIFHVNYILITGDSVKLKVTGFDPYDPLRGRYLDLNLEDNKVSLHEKIQETFNNPQAYDTPAQAYVVVKKSIDSSTTSHDTFDYMTYTKPPTTSTFIKCDIGNYLDDAGKVSIYPRIHTYYVNEQLAPTLEEQLRSPDTQAYIYLKVKNGMYTINKLEINGAIY